MATGQDGQFLKLDRQGKVLGAVGNGMGIGTGQFIEASYWVMDWGPGTGSAIQPPPGRTPIRPASAVHRATSLR